MAGAGAARAWDMGLRVVHGLVPAAGEGAVLGPYEDKESVQQVVHPVEIGPRYGRGRLERLPPTAGIDAVTCGHRLFASPHNSR